MAPLCCCAARSRSRTIIRFVALLDQLKTSPSGRRVLDLSHLEFLDSAALGMLLIADDEAKSGGWH